MPPPWKPPPPCLLRGSRRPSRGRILRPSRPRSTDPHAEAPVRVPAVPIAVSSVIWVPAITVARAVEVCAGIVVCGRPQWQAVVVVSRTTATPAGRGHLNDSAADARRRRRSLAVKEVMRAASRTRLARGESCMVMTWSTTDALAMVRLGESSFPERLVAAGQVGARRSRVRLTSAPSSILPVVPTGSSRVAISDPTPSVFTCQGAHLLGLAAPVPIQVQ